MKLRYSARTDVGQKREINEDSYGPVSLDPQVPTGLLMLVCDGMGGHAHGEVASRIGVETITQIYHSAPGDDRPAQLRVAFEEANRRIHTEGRATMGTTGVAALLLANELHIANVGDSRAYLVQNGQIGQVSRDHSLVAEHVRVGLMTLEQARVSSIKNFITRALGHQADVEVDLFRLPLHEGDIVVLSSDGLHGVVEDDEIQQAVTLLTPEKATDALVRLANERGGPDNITVIVARVDKLDQSNGLVTTELPETADEAAGAAATTVATALPPVASAPPASQTPTVPVERSLSQRGLALAGLTLLVLLGIGGYALLMPPPVAAPVAAPATMVAPSPIPSQAASPASTRSPLPASTSASATTLAATPSPRPPSTPSTPNLSPRPTP